MQVVVYLLLVSIFSVDYLSKELGVGGRAVALAPDILSVIAMGLVLFRVLATKQIAVHPKYWLFVALFALHLFLGVILNTVPTGAIFAGLRTYFRYLPFFLVPAVYILSDRDLGNQLRVILALALAQLPLVVYQRFVQYAGKNSGDSISGTLVVSSHLSIVLIAAMAVTFAFYLKGRLSVKAVVLILVCLFLPTTLNETKGSLFLIPVAMVVPVLFMAGSKKRFTALATAVVLGGLMVGGFVKLYNQSLGQTRDRSITEFFGEGQAEGYLYKEASGKRSGTEEIGKIDSFVLAFKTLADDITKLSFGLGIGNVGESFSDRLAGEYSKRYAHMAPATTTISYLIWEIGIMGLILVAFGCYLVFSDARSLSATDSTLGAFALGWTAVVCIYVISFGYKNLVTPNVIGYLFWYLSGCVAAGHLRRELEEGSVPLVWTAPPVAEKAGSDRVT